MQIGAPGDLGKGFCIKCKIPLVVELPEKIRFLCPECVRDINELVRTAKDNPDMKRMVIEPGKYRQVLPDGTKTRIQIKRKRK